MKKIRLTESQLVSLIKRALNEETTTLMTVDEVAAIAKSIQSQMTGDVNSSVLSTIRGEIAKVDGKLMDDGSCAIEKALQYYTHYAKNDFWGNSGSKKELIGDIQESGESSEPQFGDNQTLTVKKINDAKAKCATLKTQQNASQSPTELKSCASKETGFIDKGDWWIIKPFGNGELRGYSDGRKNGNGNLFFVPAGGSTNSHVANGSCVNGVLDIGAWSVK